MSKSQASSSVRFIDRTINGIVTSPWLWGIAVTFGFYATLPYFPIYQQSIDRYFNAHWIEHTTTGLFFIGMAILLMKAAKIPGERSALAADLLDGLKLDQKQDPVESVETINSHLDLVARRSEESASWSVASGKSRTTSSLVDRRTMWKGT